MIFTALMQAYTRATLAAFIVLDYVLQLRQVEGELKLGILLYSYHQAPLHY